MFVLVTQICQNDTQSNRIITNMFRNHEDALGGAPPNKYNSTNNVGAGVGYPSHTLVSSWEGFGGECPPPWCDSCTYVTACTEVISFQLAFHRAVKFLANSVDSTAGVANRLYAYNSLHTVPWRLVFSCCQVTWGESPPTASWSKYSACMGGVTPHSV